MRHGKCNMRKRRINCKIEIEKNRVEAFSMLQVAALLHGEKGHIFRITDIEGNSYDFEYIESVTPFSPLGYLHCFVRLPSGSICISQIDFESCDDKIKLVGYSILRGGRQAEEERNEF